MELTYGSSIKHESGGHVPGGLSRVDRGGGGESEKRPLQMGSPGGGDIPPGCLNKEASRQKEQPLA